LKFSRSYPVAWLTLLGFICLLISGVLVACQPSREVSEALRNTAGMTPAAVSQATLPSTFFQETPASAPIVLTDGAGKTITLPAPATRIVSLAPSNTEILFALGAGSQVVGRDNYSDYPPEAQQVTDIGGGFGALDSEAILALQPDLVMAASLTPPEQVQALSDLGLTVFTLANPTDLDGMYINLLTVASLTGRQEEAQAMIPGLKARVAAVQAQLTGVQQRPLVFYELDGTDPNAPWTPGPGTFINTLIDMAGGKNLGATLQGDWVQISIEALIKDDPDIILLGDAYWGGVTPEAVAARTGWEALRAVQAGQVYPFDDNLVSRPGPRLVDGLEALAKFLHPELFP
jgi:iron complex transport system substrate-binding protein